MEYHYKVHIDEAIYQYGSYRQYPAYTMEQMLEWKSGRT